MLVPGLISGQMEKSEPAIADFHNQQSPALLVDLNKKGAKH